MKPLLTLITLTIFFTSNQTSETNDLHFLAGTWKIEHKENYEAWEVKEKGVLQGKSYKIRNGVSKIDEHLTIKVVGEKIIYAAKVLNQNNAQPIEFVLNKSVKDKFSFENANHDFPKKIQYTKRNDSTLFVAVLGDNDKGFSYNMIKQKSLNQ